MNEKERVKLSKLLSLVLRHDPGAAGVELDQSGWVSVKALLSGLAERGNQVTLAELHEIVATSDKKRFALSADGDSIRANQGHSVEVELGYSAQTPPVTLFHGTATRFLQSIAEKGLIRGSRHHVHLSASIETASRVGVRYGELALLTVKAHEMHEQGFQFFCSDNQVWLTEHVPPQFIVFPEGE